MNWDDTAQLSTLIGKTMASVTLIKPNAGSSRPHDEIVFVTTDGETYKLYHEEDCCELVYVEDVAEDLDDLVGSPITMAECVESGKDDDPDPDVSPVPKPENCDESWTWTFYKFATVKGYVTIRWFGTSNGYYSETVTFAKVD